MKSSIIVFPGSNCDRDISIALEKFNDIVVGDVFECFEVQESGAKL